VPLLFLGVAAHDRPDKGIGTVRQLYRARSAVGRKIEHTIPTRKCIREPLIFASAKIYCSWEIGNILPRRFANGKKFPLCFGFPTKNKNVLTDAFRDTGSYVTWTNTQVMKSNANVRPNSISSFLNVIRIWTG
jgi:hypothetical protein